MSKFLSLVLSGIVTGAIYSIMASGLVLTYTTSGIFNFAHGAIAFATAYLYYQLNYGQGVPIVPSLIISVFVFAPALGLLLDRLLLRRLAEAPVYARIVGTIGLLVALPNLVQWLVLDVGNGVLNLDLAGNDRLTSGVRVAGVGPSPPHYYRLLRGVVLDSDQLAVFVVATLAAVSLWFVLRHTRIGLEMRAVVDREPLANLRGVNPARTSAIAWVMTMVLAGFGGVLIAPLFTLNATIYTFVVLGALAAVVLGDLRSIPIAFAGGLALGVLQNLVAGYSDDFLPDWLSSLSGLKSSVPFVLTLVLLLVFGRDRSRRAGSMADEAPRPDHRQGLPAWRQRLPWAVFTFALLAFSLEWIDVSWLQADAYWQTVIAQSLAMATIFLSFVVVTGMGGMVSLAQATFVTAAGFAAGWALSLDLGISIPGVAGDGQINFLWATVLGVVIAAALGALFAIPLSRLGGVNLALGTLALAFFCAFVPFATETIGNGEAGWFIRSPTLDVPVLNWVHDLIVPGAQGGFDFAQLPDQILLFLAVFGLVTAVIHLLQRSASGRAILAVRSSEVAARASGVRADRSKVMIFALSAGIAGLGGVMLGLFSFGVNNSTAPPYVGLFWLALAVTFGIRRPAGALLAGFAFAAGTAIFEWISDLLPGSTASALLTSIYFVPILSGIGAIQLAQEPDGILALVGHQRLAKKRDKERKARIVAAEERVHAAPIVAKRVDLAAAPADDGDGPTAALALRQVVAGYGDVEVLHGVDLALEPGKVTALLGANGAGKSTLCAVAAGLVTPVAGTVRLDGIDVTAAPPFRRARAGLLLIPEARGIFPGLTVDENLAVSLRAAEIHAALTRFPQLAERRTQIAGLLSGGEQQMLGLAPALAQPPAVLVADEPTLGLAPLAADAVIQTIGELRDRGAAVLLVEEHAQHALQVADTLAFMELGRIVWIGARTDADMELLAGAYLGSSTSPRVSP